MGEKLIIVLGKKEAVIAVVGAAALGAALYVGNKLTTKAFNWALRKDRKMVIIDKDGKVIG